MALPTQEYLKTKVMTASAEMLTLMLWDGAIRFAEQGKDAILKKDIESSYKALVRSQKIVMELNASLKHDVNPDLCGKLASLYNFIYRRLVEANLEKDPKFVDDALEIMRHQRETWVLLMDKLAKERVSENRDTVTANADAVSTSDQIPAILSPSVRNKYEYKFAVSDTESKAKYLSTDISNLLDLFSSCRVYLYLDGAKRCFRVRGFWKLRFARLFTVFRFLVVLCTLITLVRPTPLETLLALLIDELPVLFVSISYKLAIFNSALYPAYSSSEPEPASPLPDSPPCNAE